MTDSPHDKLFKEAFGNVENAAGLIRSMVPPALVEHIDFASLTPVPADFRDVALRDSQSDLLFSVRIAGREAFVYVLFEHKSSTDRWVPLQLLRYKARIWERCRAHISDLTCLPPVIPIVVHHQDSGWTAGTSFFEIMDPAVHDIPDLARLTPRFEFLVDDIGRATDDEIRARALNAFGTLALLFLRDVRATERFLLRFPLWVDLLRSLQRAESGRDALMVLFRYVSMVADQLGVQRFQQVVHNVLPEAEDSLMTIAEEMRQLGLEQGMQQGLEQGMQQGLQSQRALLIEQLRIKFGNVDEHVVQLLDAANEPALKRYARRIISASTLTEVFANEG
ncbi:MAG TPA: Rpn family recombination-promoting nuclease/putative transposase [Polyangiaceae bacterium]